MRTPANLRSLPAAMASFLLLSSLMAMQVAAEQADDPAGTVIVLHQTEPDPTWLRAFQPLRERMKVVFRATEGLNVSTEGPAFILVPASASAAGKTPPTERLVPLPEDAADLRDLCESAVAILAAIDTHLENAPARGREAKPANPINTPSP